LVNVATVLVPLSAAFLFGILTGRSSGFFIGVTLLSFGPLIFGVNDLIFELADSVEREQKRRRALAIEVETFARHREEFVRELRTLGFDELWQICLALNQRQRGIAKSKGDPVVDALERVGWIAPSAGFNAFGFPYYFTDAAWIVLNRLGALVFEERDLLARQRLVRVETLPPYVPPPEVRSLEERLLELPGRLAMTVIAGFAGFFGIIATGSIATAIFFAMLALGVGVVIGLGLAIDEVLSWIGRLLG
jgi:hypothetical protein